MSLSICVIIRRSCGVWYCFSFAALWLFASTATRTNAIDTVKMWSSRRSEGVEPTLGSVHYQYYFNRKGIPLSNDYILYEKEFGQGNSMMWSYYYQ